MILEAWYEILQISREVASECSSAKLLLRTSDFKISGGGVEVQRVCLVLCALLMSYSQPAVCIDRPLSTGHSNSSHCIVTVKEVAWAAWVCGVEGVAKLTTAAVDIPDWLAVDLLDVNRLEECQHKQSP